MADTARNADLSLFVIEWGASHADGGLDGGTRLSEAQRWTAWKLDVGYGSANLLPTAPLFPEIGTTATTAAPPS